MLFVTFCRVSPKQMKPSMLHVWLLLFQVVVCIAVYLLLLPLNDVVAQGAMVCVLAPVAMAAVVIAGMLGANVATMATYSLICNMAIALVAPVILTFTGTGECTFAQILARIAPLLVGPLRCRAIFPLRLPETRQVDRGARADLLLHVADVAARDHRAHDLLHHRPARRLGLHGVVAGLCGAGDLPGAVQGRSRNRAPLRRSPPPEVSRSARKTPCWQSGWLSHS